jgi:hypothetical protein
MTGDRYVDGNRGQNMARSLGATAPFAYQNRRSMNDRRL